MGRRIAADDKGLEGPHRPERYNGNEVIVRADDALFALDLSRQVIGEECASGACAMLREMLRLARSREGNRLLRPDLSMRMRVARAHHLALVLEDLDVIDVRAGPETLVFLRPDIHDA